MVSRVVRTLMLDKVPYGSTEYLESNVEDYSDILRISNGKNEKILNFPELIDYILHTFPATKGDRAGYDNMISSSICVAGKKTGMNNEFRHYSHPTLMIVNKKNKMLDLNDNDLRLLEVCSGGAVTTTTYFEELLDNETAGQDVKSLRLPDITLFPLTAKYADLYYFLLHPITLHLFGTEDRATKFFKLNRKATIRYPNVLSVPVAYFIQVNPYTGEIICDSNIHSCGRVVSVVKDESVAQNNKHSTIEDIIDKNIETQGTILYDGKLSPEQEEKLALEKMRKGEGFVYKGTLFVAIQPKDK